MEILRRAPAKINLALRVTGRRQDGYHLLDSIFLPVAFFDDIRITMQQADETSIVCCCGGRADLEGESNLAARAAKAWLDALEVTAAVSIDIEKRIWTGAGLGGGSSDAAAVLLALEEWCDRETAVVRRRLSGEELRRLAEGLGADVPFFLLERPARACGIGSDLAPLSNVPPVHLVLANPQEEVSTPAVYQRLGLARGSTCEREPLPEDLAGSIDTVVSLIANDLEKPAVALCPRIGDVRRALAEEAVLGVGMSGSGATVFAVTQSADDAAAVAANVRKKTDFSVFAGDCLA